MRSGMPKLIPSLSQPFQLISISRLQESIVSLNITPVMPLSTVKANEVKDTMLSISTTWNVHVKFILFIFVYSLKVINIIKDSNFIITKLQIIYIMAISFIIDFILVYIDKFFKRKNKLECRQWSFKMMRYFQLL